MSTMEFLHTMKNVSFMVSDTLSRNFVNDCCKNADIVFQDFVDKSNNLVGHFPKFEEIYQMSTTPSLWSDLFSVECNMLCNRLLLNTNIDISKLMYSHVSRGSVDSSYSKRMELMSQFQNLSEQNIYIKTYGSDINIQNFNKKFESVEQSISDGFRPCSKSHTQSSRNFTTVTSTLSESISKNRNSNSPFSRRSSLNPSHDLNPNSSDNCNLNPEFGDLGSSDSESLSTLFSIISNLSVYNERLNVKCFEDRQFYEKSCKRLFYLSEEDLLNRPEFIKRGRGKVLQFLKQLSRTFDIDKCTHNLAILFFDSYLHQCTGGSGVVHSPGSYSHNNSEYYQDEDSTDFGLLSDNEMIKIATACYLLAGALREHWVDINKDKYLEQAIEMSYNSFTTKEVVSVQLDVLHRMPKGFTSIYTCMEYGLFFLANIKYINYDLDLYPYSSTESRLNYFDDFLFLSSSFKFMVETGSLCWVYHCLSKWDDLYVAKNWNRFIPPSRCAAVLVFHFFVSFFKIDFEKDVVWCRRFSHRVFRMFFDSDVSLWYFVFKENIRSFLLCIEKSSTRMYQMSSLFSLSANVFRAIEALICLYHTKILLQQYFCTPLDSLSNTESNKKPPQLTLRKNLRSNKNRLSNLNKPDQSSKSVSDSTMTPETKLFGLDYSNFTMLLSNLIDVLQQS